jgi:4,5-DOPA dioxygenase extradiol
MNRKSFLKMAATLPLTYSTMKLNAFENLTDDFKSSEKMPGLFIGHGNPMNVLTDNVWRKGWEQMSLKLPKPKAILVISAHWLTHGTYVTMTDKPQTIHDFGGFPEALFQQQYPVSGAVDFAKMTIDNVKKVVVHEDYKWGLDHGSWCILKPMFPKADIPVFQMSLNFDAPPQYHYDLAKELAFLREKGVLIISSGNVVHNFIGFQAGGKTSYDWAIEFDNIVKESIEKWDDKPLIEYEKLGKLAYQAHPSNDHYLPLMYTLGLRQKDDKVTFFNESFDVGSMSMRSIVFS